MDMVLIVFFVGGFVGTFLGMLAVSLGAMAKRNVHDMPEIPLKMPELRMTNMG